MCIRDSQLEVLKRDLHTLNLRALDDSVFDVKTEQELIEVQLAVSYTHLDVYKRQVPAPS